MSSRTLACKLAEQHADILDGLKNRDARTENRRAPRFEFRARGQIHPCHDGQLGEPMAVQFQDFSQRGLSFHTKAQMAAGQQFVFHFPRKDGGTTPVLCTIAYCRRSSDTEHRVGAEFTCVVRPNTAAAASAAAADSDLERIKRSILD